MEQIKLKMVPTKITPICLFFLLVFHYSVPGMARQETGSQPERSEVFTVTDMDELHFFFHDQVTESDFENHDQYTQFRLLKFHFDLDNVRDSRRRKAIRWSKFAATFLTAFPGVLLLGLSAENFYKQWAKTLPPGNYKFGIFDGLVTLTLPLIAATVFLGTDPLIEAIEKSMKTYRSVQSYLEVYCDRFNQLSTTKQLTIGNKRHRFHVLKEKVQALHPFLKPSEPLALETLNESNLEPGEKQPVGIKGRVPTGDINFH